MRIVPVGEGRLCFLTCCVCGKRGASDKMLADLDGEPYKAYLHPECEATYRKQEKEN